MWRDETWPCPLRMESRCPSCTWKGSCPPTYPFVPLLSTAVLFHKYCAGFTFLGEQYSGEGCSTDVPGL